MKKSFKDYAIYFLTLILGVAIFYVFNSIDSQEAMLNVSQSTREIIKLMLTILGGVSVLISFILGFLIVYANNFLIKRRKKEFGIYMTLGMGKGQISRILLIETILIGVISLAVGLGLGIIASQFMSILVAKMFAADMSQFTFVFSQAALIKTVIYFGIMYLVVMIFNAFSISKYKLIDLMNAIKQNEKIKIKNPIISVILFLVSIGMLVYAYMQATAGASTWQSPNKIYELMIVGSLATFLFFWSLSGFILKLVQSSKKLYLKNLNMFVLRQINSKINTTVFSMTVICLMLFVTICVLSSALSLNNSMQRDLKELTPVDITVNKIMDIQPEKTDKQYSQERIEDSKKTIIESLEDLGFNVEQELKDCVEITEYTSEELTLKQSLGTTLPEVKQSFRLLKDDTQEGVLSVSDYNKVARLYGVEELDLKENEYLVLCDYDNMKVLRNKALEVGTELTLNGKQYKPKQKECVSGFIQISAQHINSGIIILPDEAVTGMQREENYLNANYNANTEEGKKEIEEKINQLSNLEKIQNETVVLEANTKIVVYESSRGIGATVIFIGIYLGIIFLIAGAAILALKELSESSDNVQRYAILRKIGADEKMIHRSLFTQIGIFFSIPLLLAIIHSIFGLQFANMILKSMGQQNMLPSIMMTAAVIIAIYGGYFLATYFGSKNMIKPNK